MFGLGPQEFVAILLAAGMYGVLFLLPLAALVHCLTKRFDAPSGRLVWVITIICVPVVGPLLWFAIGRAQAAGGASSWRTS